MTTPAIKSIKVTKEAHYQLKLMALKYGEHVWQLVNEAVVLLGRKKAGRNGSRVKGGK